MSRSALTLGLTILLAFPVCYGSASVASWFVDYQPEYGTLNVQDLGHQWMVVEEK